MKINQQSKVTPPAAHGSSDPVASQWTAPGSGSEVVPRARHPAQVAFNLGVVSDLRARRKLPLDRSDQKFKLLPRRHIAGGFGHRGIEV